jgi:citrate/tricarballylate utilization protein
VPHDKTVIDETIIQEGARILTICNACRYCEGFCAVFPAMEKRQEFLRADLNYLANLCHNCQECFYACQYAPPHEFAVNVPKTLAQIRIASYEQYAWPSWWRGYASQVAGMIILASWAATLWLKPKASGGDFYGVIPHWVMAAVFGGIAIVVTFALAASMMRFWREAGAKGSVHGIGRALRDIFRLEYLRSGGAGCTYPREDHSKARWWFHHLTFYGFFLCFASTAVGAIYHYVFSWSAPYGYLSAPVILGTAGGAGLLLGTAGLAWLKRRQDSATANAGQADLDWEFMGLLFLTSLTGLLLLVVRETRWMPALLAVHLGFVAALFVTMPYGKFVHGLYRSLALLRYAREQD